MERKSKLELEWEPTEKETQVIFLFAKRLGFNPQIL